MTRTVAIATIIQQKKRTGWQYTLFVGISSNSSYNKCHGKNHKIKQACYHATVPGLLQTYSYEQRKMMRQECCCQLKEKTKSLYRTKSPRERDNRYKAEGPKEGKDRCKAEDPKEKTGSLQGARPPRRREKEQQHSRHHVAIVRRRPFRTIA